MLLALFSSAYPQGNLVIVGGGLEPDNREIFEEYIRLAGGKDAVIAVIPAASGISQQTFDYFSGGLMNFGVKPENIHLIPIAMEDDDSTPEVDESSWKGNGFDPLLAKKVRSCSGIWFSGGDQSRIIQLLHSEEGNPSPVLEAVWEVYRNGGVVGGTSAGAAIMSDPMIGSGTSLNALQFGAVDTDGKQHTDTLPGVTITKGLGFFPYGMVDQHFHARTRTGRLITAIGHTKQQFGFGVDENTALVYYGKEKYLQVAGEAGVTIFDTKNTRFYKAEGYNGIENIGVSYLENGDRFYFESHKIVPSSEKAEIKYSFVENKDIFVAPGAFSNSEAGFYQLLTHHFFDNDGITWVHNLNFLNREIAFELSITRQPESHFYLFEPERGRDRFTAAGLRMDILPVRIKTTPLEK